MNINIKVPVSPRLVALAAQFGTHIQDARLRRGISLSEIRRKIGITKATLESIEKGAISVSLGRYIQILSILELEDDILLVAKADRIGREIEARRLAEAEAKAKAEEEAKAEAKKAKAEAKAKQRLLTKKD